MGRPDFTASFGAHPVPQLLDDLAEFAADGKAYFSGRFKLQPGDAAGWLGNAGAASDFAVFGHDPDGSLYAFWLYEGRTPADAPIVYLAAGHEGSLVLANNLEEFLGMLALDIPDLGVYYDEADRPRKASPGHKAFVRWLAECFGIKPATNAERIVKRAGAAHPKLTAYYGRRGA